MTNQLSRMIGVASDLRPETVTAVLVAVHDRAALTLGAVTVQALLYAVVLQVPPFSSSAVRLVNSREPDALLAACANAPVAHTAEILTRFLDLVDRLTGGVMAEPLQNAAQAVLAGAPQDAGAQAGSMM